MIDQRIVVGLIVSFGCVSLWSASKIIPLGAGRDVARSYIALALGLLSLKEVGLVEV